ncbi:sequestosome-1 isoform X1 [Schistocerca cancellata]|uniref:sequestosome-1 isoform X1 n=1 Tax=Schistocerca cancellata TaxID=274614 RepID=UPI0021190D5D|nr:sequestosome-1 isoform X1 [Schistocerca cancellata]
MAESMSISYKVYLEDGTDTTEVRRFGIDRSLAFKFNFLREKLQKVFPSLQNRNFYVSWKDQEGDIITISSDEELTLALSEMNTDVRKLYVAVKPEETLAPDAEMPEMGRPIDGPAVHEGVTCDGCNKLIVGFRYKCAVCPDFDLCSSCEGFGMHDEHFMIRISKPIKWRSTYSRRLAHHMAKWSRQSETHRHHHQRRTNNVKGVNESNVQCPYRRSYSEHPGWLEYLCSQLGEWVNLPGEVEIPPKAGNTATTTENATPKPSTSSAAECTEGPQGTATQRNSNQQRDTTYLQNVGETVAALLSPLGIDVEIQVKDKNQKQTGEKQDTPQGAAQAKEAEKTAQAKESENTAQAKKAENIAQAKEAEKNVQFGEAEMAEAASVSEPMEVSPETPSAPPEQHSSESEEWTVLIPDNVGSPNPVASKAVDELLKTLEEPYYCPIYPRVDDVIARTRELELQSITDPKVAKTLKQLLAMGFTNEGGWLTQLIQIKDGNIDRVLDVLLPVKK